MRRKEEQDNIRRKEELDNIQKLHEEKVNRLLSESAHFNKEIINVIKEKELSDDRIKTMQIENLNLHNRALEKNREYVELQDNMNIKITESYNNLIDKENIFHQSVTFKTDEYFKFNREQHVLIKKEHETLYDNQILFEKVNRSQQDLENTVLEWKKIGNNFKKQGEDELSNVHKTYNHKISEINKYS